MILKKEVGSAVKVWVTKWCNMQYKLQCKSNVQATAVKRLHM